MNPNQVNAHPSNPTWTVASLLAWAQQDFSTRGMLNARLDAEVLLAGALNLDRVGVYLQFDQPVSDAERERFRELVIQRRAGTPVAYLIGEKEFYSLSFYVDRRVLIPRPETEILVDEVVHDLKSRPDAAVRICDVGTGAGAVAIALAKTLPSAEVVGVDVSGEALDVARKNAARHDVSITWIESNLLSDVEGPFDVIVANLPYIRQADIELLPPDIRDYEPRVALDGGEDGMREITRLVDQIQEKPFGGTLFLEFGDGQDRLVSQRLIEKGYVVRRIRDDYAGKPRIVVAEKE